MAEVFTNMGKQQDDSRSWEALARFVVLAAFSGRPDTVDSLKESLTPTAPHEVFLKSLTEFLLAKKPFWRGGQAHGRLSTSELSSAFSAFFTFHANSLARNLHSWGVGTTSSSRDTAVRLVYQSLKKSSVFKAGDYFVKRALDICILAGTRKILNFQSVAADLDLIFDVWPVGKGTRAGLHLIWPKGLQGQQCERQALRVLQRALGRGTHKVPLVRVSACLCFWQRALNGTLPWEVIAIVGNYKKRKQQHKR